MDSISQGFNQGTLQKGQAGRDSEKTLLWDRNVFRQPSVKVQAIYLSLGADMLAMGLAITTLPAAYQGINGHRLSYPKGGDSLVNLHDITAKLMTQYQGGNPLLALAQETI